MKSQSSNLRSAETGRQTQPAFLYFLTYEDGTKFFFTNYDRDITVSGGTGDGFAGDPQTFSSVQITHSPPTEDVDMKSSAIQVALAATDTRLRNYFVNAPTLKISIKIYRVNSSNLPGTIAYADIYMEFAGVAITVGFKGYVISATFLPPVLQEDHQIPNFFYQRSCNHRLYGTFCGVNKATWTKATTVAAANRVNKTIDVADTTINSKTITAETFQGGVIVDANQNQIGVIACEVLPSSAGTRLYLIWWPGFTVGDSISIISGCLKIPRVCNDWFENIDNFGGTPCIPISNPAVNGVST